MSKNCQFMLSTDIFTTKQNIPKHFTVPGTSALLFVKLRHVSSRRRRGQRMALRQHWQQTWRKNVAPSPSKMQLGSNSSHSCKCQIQPFWAREMNLVLFTLCFTFLLAFGACDKVQEKQESESEEPETTETSDNEPKKEAISMFSMLFNSEDSVPFEINQPELELTPTKFGINESPRNFPKEAIERLLKGTTTSEGQKRRQKRHISPGSLSFFNRPVFDNLFGDITAPLFNRDPRKARRPRPQRPVYPPLDPFGTTEYIPLPGASNPAYALPINSENPHFHKPHHFRRPIRQVKYLQHFLYDSSLDFYQNQQAVLSQIRPNRPWLNCSFVIIIEMFNIHLWYCQARHWMSSNWLLGSKSG